MVGWLIWRLLGLRTRGQAVTPYAFTTSGRPQRVESDAPQLLGRAREEMARGAWIEAMRLIDQAAISALQRRGLLPPRPGLTDRESLDSLRESADSSVGSALRELVSLHEQMVYAGTGGSREITARALELGTTIVEPATESP